MLQLRFTVQHAVHKIDSDGDVIEKQIKRRNVDQTGCIGITIFEITYCLMKSPFPIIHLLIIYFHFDDEFIFAFLLYKHFCFSKKF
jgi:hypothetical protein